MSLLAGGWTRGQVMLGFSESTEASRRADVLASAAGSALERIVRLRKRG